MPKPVQLTQDGRLDRNARYLVGKRFMTRDERMALDINLSLQEINDEIKIINIELAKLGKLWREIEFYPDSDYSDDLNMLINGCYSGLSYWNEIRTAKLKLTWQGQVQLWAENAWRVIYKYTGIPKLHWWLHVREFRQREAVHKQAMLNIQLQQTIQARRTMQER